MTKVREIPEGSGVNPWFELSKFKNFNFKSANEIKDFYDYVVVGAGFAGVSAAYRLSENEPHASIALIDALPIGYFSSGRNAGFISYAQYGKSLVGRNTFTIEDQNYLLRLNRIGINRIEKLKNEKNIDFQWRKDGFYKAVKNPNRFADLEELHKFYDNLGVKHEVLDKDETSKRLGTDFYERSVYVEDAVLNNPSEAVRGLAANLPKPDFDRFKCI